MNSWHHDRDGFGTVLGPADDKMGYTSYPVLGSGYTYDEAVAKFGPATRHDQPIPVTIDVPEGR
jgi:hypothetical protein